MRLVKFRVEGFRCLGDTEWIPLKKTTIFTGQNDAGKTSVLDALDVFLNPKAEPEREDYTIRSASGERVENVTMKGLFTLNTNEREILRVIGDSLHVKRQFSSSGGSTMTYETKVHSDERFRRDLREVPIQELRTLASEFQIELSNKTSKEAVVMDIERWLSEQQLVPG
jgi:predicted ATP-dependent endonuclease of OLD family